MHKIRDSHLYLGDCVKVLDDIPDNSIDCIITSPPYNFNMDYDNYSDNMNFDEYFEWLTDVFVKCKKKLKSDGRLMLNIQPLFSKYIPSHSIITAKLLDIGYKWKAEILWEKNNYNCAYTAWGSWRSPASPYFKYTHEYILVFVNEEYKHVGNSDDITITADEFKAWVNTKWSITPETNMNNIYNHPAMFPEALTNRLIKLFTYRDDVIMDIFMGCGTTGVSCMKLDRNFIGIEISEDYYNKAKRRIEDVRKNIKRKLF